MLGLTCFLSDISFQRSCWCSRRSVVLLVWKGSNNSKPKANTSIRWALVFNRYGGCRNINACVHTSCIYTHVLMHVYIYTQKCGFVYTHILYIQEFHLHACTNFNQVNDEQRSNPHVGRSHAGYIPVYASYGLEADHLSIREPSPLGKFHLSCHWAGGILNPI